MDKAYPYDFDEATLLLSKGSRHEDLAKRYGYASHSGFTRRYNRDKNKQTQALKQQYTAKKNAVVSTEGNHISEAETEVVLYAPDFDHTTIDIMDIVSWGLKHCKFFTWSPLPDYIARFMKEVWTRNKTLTIYPRDHGKTIALCVLFLYWVLELNRSVLVIAGLPYKIWRICLSVLDDEYIQAKYNYTIIKKDENKGILYTSRQRSQDPIFSVSGWGGKYVGAHPDWVHLEDIIQLMPVAEATSERLYQNFNDNVRDLAQRLSISGTRKDYNDFYAQLKKKYFLELREVALELTGKYPEWSDVIFEDYTDPYGNIQQIPVSLKQEYMDSIEYKTLECPHWTIEKLLFRYLDDRASFMSQFQNDPLPRGGKYFDPKYWITIPDYTPERIIGKCYIAVDPAFGKTTGADYYAVVVGIITMGKLDIVKTELLKGLGFNQAIDLLQFYSNTYKPMAMMIETTFWQALIEEEASKTIPNIIPITHQETKKTERIDTLESPYARGMIRVCEGMGYMQEAYDQFILYDRLPSTPEKKDDWLDAVEMLWNRTKWYLYGQKIESGVLEMTV